MTWRIKPQIIDSLLSVFCRCVKLRVKVSIGFKVRVRVGFKVRFRVGFKVRVS